MIRGFLLSLLLFSFPAFAQVSVDLSVLDDGERRVVKQAEPSPALTATEEGAALFSVDDLRLKYADYPFTATPVSAPVADAPSEDSSVAMPVPIIKPVDLFVPIPAPTLSVRPRLPEPEIVSKTVPKVEVLAVVEEDVAEVVFDVVSEPVIVEGDAVPLVAAPPPSVQVEMIQVEEIEMEPAESVVEFVEAPAQTDFDKEPDAADIKGLRIAGIGYNDDDIRINSTVMQAFKTTYVPQINAQKSYRLGLYSYASSEERGERKARRLSLSRALELRSFLIGAGVDAGRIDIFPLGDKAADGFKDRVDLILQK